MTITPSRLTEIMGITAAASERWAKPLNDAMAMYSINTYKRMAAFLAQIGHESGRLVYTREIWGPTAAQRGYEGRADLGNTHPGDGQKYRGRGLIQITGRANYRAVSKALGINFEEHPELLEQPEEAAMSAGWFWHSRNLNVFADEGSESGFKAITKRINGGHNGLEDRIYLWKRAAKVLGA